MSLKQSNNKVITVLLLVLVLIVGVVCSPLYVEYSHRHDCSGADCQVCLAISVIGSCCNYILPGLLPLLLRLLLRTESMGRQVLPVVSAKLTLIGLKVRLDN